MRVYFSFALIFLFCSCSRNLSIKTKDLDITLSADGKITGIRSGNSTVFKNATAFTEIEGCSVSGKTEINTNKDGAIEFVRKLINDSTHQDCTVSDRFSATANSVRWEVSIRGGGEPWSAPVKTVLAWPTDSNSRFWTSWGRPKYDSTASDEIKQALEPIKGSSPEAFIMDNADKNWTDPLVPVPFISDTFFYGAPPPYSYARSLKSAEWTFFRQLFSVPEVSVIDAKDRYAVHLVLSPDDNILNMTMTTSGDGKITFSRLHNRITKNNDVVFSMDLVGDTADDWRGGMAWMINRYPEYFRPKNPKANELNGTGAYSNYYKPLDAVKMKQMGFTVNWQASFDFPYMGMFLPPVSRDLKWKRFGGGEMSLRQMSDYATQMKNDGFFVLNYFNVTEFGAHIKYPDSLSSHSSDSSSWKDANGYLYTHLSDAILKYTDRFDTATTGGVPSRTWGDALVMDCGDSAYSKFIIEQAQRHVKEIPDAFGICIDRLDWLNIYNIRGDDGVSWLDGKPVRALSISYKKLMEKLGPVMHDAGKYILANSIGRRVDYFKHVDGVFDEFTYSGTPLNTSAFMCFEKPALGWTDETGTVLDAGVDNFFQKYLYMGVFPMCPYPGNDHSLGSNDSVKQVYVDYRPMMQKMKTRKWVLAPHPLSVENNTAKANLFSVDEGFCIPVVYGKQKHVKLLISEAVVGKDVRATVLYPGTDKVVEVPLSVENGMIAASFDLVRGCGMLLLKK